jgi:hypothetical protein
MSQDLSCQKQGMHNLKGFSIVNLPDFYADISRKTMPLVFEWYEI